MTKQERYDNYFINRCIEAAAMSYCKRGQVGAVAVKNNRTILDGWNGTIPGTDNCCETKVCDKCNGSGTIDIAHGTIECSRCNGEGKITDHGLVIHAERNIIFYAAKEGIPLEGATMYITHAPCIGCAQAMAASGIKEVVYKNNYKTTEGVDFLRSINIKVRQIK